MLAELIYSTEGHPADFRRVWLLRRAGCGETPCLCTVCTEVLPGEAAEALVQSRAGRSQCTGGMGSAGPLRTLEQTSQPHAIESERVAQRPGKGDFLKSPT